MSSWMKCSKAEEYGNDGHRLGLDGASAQAAANAKRYADAGGMVSVATDYGCCGQAAGLPPYLQETQFLQGAGMTPMQLLMAATRSGAIMSNVGQNVGILERGKFVDIVVVDGNPLSACRRSIM